MRKTQILFIGLLAFGIAGIAWLLTPRPVLVEATPAVSATFQDAIEEDGRAQVRDRYTVSAPVSGRVGRIALKAGGEVRKGQVLTTVLPEISPLLAARTRQELEERIGAAEAAAKESASLHEQSKVLLAQARAELARSETLAENDFVSAARLEQKRYAVEAAERAETAAEMRKHVAEHNLEQAQRALNQETDPDDGQAYPVVSPIDGKMLKVIRESASYVSVGTPLVELGDPRDLEIAVDVLTTDAARIRPGDQAVITRWGGPVDLEGRVRVIEPSGFSKVSALGVEEQRVWVYADITSPRELWAALGDGYRVEVRIVVDVIENATVVPVGALFRRGEDWSLFVVQDGRARLRRLSVARISGRTAAVTEGVLPDESVVLYPPAALTDGARVRLR